jgi:hypothetical protein
VTFTDPKIKSDSDDNDGGSWNGDNDDNDGNNNGEKCEDSDNDSNNCDRDDDDGHNRKTPEPSSVILLVGGFGFCLLVGGRMLRGQATTDRLQSH